MPGHTNCCTCHAKSSSQDWRSDATKCNPSQEIRGLTSQHLWSTCLLYCACHGKFICADPLQMSHACHRFWTCYKTLTFSIPCASHVKKRRFKVQKWRLHVVFCTFWLGNLLPATTACNFLTSQLPKVFRTWSAFSFFTCKCANVLRATTACNFPSLIWPDGSAPAALARLFSTLRNLKSLEKHSEWRLSYLFAHLHLLSSDSFSSLIFSLLLFSFLTLPTSAFPSVHIVGSLTSKLPSAITLYIYIYIHVSYIHTYTMCIYIYTYIYV